jgi:hypothetical protein
MSITLNAQCSDGYVVDCSGDGDCIDASWIGDGYGDCQNQEYGADLTCYDNDGGDCDDWILYEAYGCMDELASNYNPDANIDDGLCEYPFLGCTDENAVNYNSEATEDDGLCEYPPNCTYDVVADGNINVSDLIFMVNDILSNISVMYGYNCDGILNILDIHGAVQTILGTPITNNDGGLIYANSYSVGIAISSENGSLYGLQISFDSIISQDEVVYIEDNFSLPNHSIAVGGGHILIFSIYGAPLPENFSILFPLSMQMNITNIIASNYDAGSMYVNTSLEGCTDENGVFYDEGVQWNTDPCTLCSCEDGEIFCSTVDCAIPECEEPNYLDDIAGECCPVCIEVETVSDCEQQDIPIDLPEGWSLFGYTCLESVDVIEAFADFSESINIVKDYLGNAYLPSWSFNAIGELQFARGYQIKMIETVEDFQFCTTPSIMQGASQEELDAYYDNGYSEGAASIDITSDNQAVFDEGAASVTPEDGITQADVDAAVAEVEASYAGWCASDVDDDGVCDVDEVSGCMDASSCNYVSAAEFDDDSCDYVSCLDECGVVNGDNSTCLDCAGVVNGTSEDLGCGCGNPAAQAGYYCDGNEIVLQIGALHAGGIVFQINEDGTGLVAELQDLGEMNWYEAMYAASNATSQGYDDWYLPDIDELELMYNTIGQGADNSGGFEDSWYWSSSEYGNSVSWDFYFFSGYSDYYNAYSTHRVRIIRAF